jgi:hypothetical protein
MPRCLTVLSILVWPNTSWTAPVDQGCFCTSQRVRPKRPWVQPYAADAFRNEARILARCHAASGTATTGEQELTGFLLAAFR